MKRWLTCVSAMVFLAPFNQSLSYVTDNCILMKEPVDGTKIKVTEAGIDLYFGDILHVSTQKPSNSGGTQTIREGWINGEYTSVKKTGDEIALEFAAEMYSYSIRGQLTESETVEFFECASNKAAIK